MYEEDLRCTEEQAAEFENVEKTTLRFTSFPAIAKEELKLVWFKYAPYALKRVVHVDMNRFTMIVEPNSDSELFHYVNWDFYPDAQNAQVTTVPDKVFKFIHIEGAHVPLRYDKDVNIIGSDKGTYDQNVQAAMTVLKQYLDDLKAAGVYDNTAIVVMADHGYWTYWDDKLLGRSNPLLAVKGVEKAMSCPCPKRRFPMRIFRSASPGCWTERPPIRCSTPRRAISGFAGIFPTTIWRKGISWSLSRRAMPRIWGRWLPPDGCLTRRSGRRATEKT